MNEPRIDEASVTFVQDGNTLGTTADPEVLTIRMDVQAGADGPFYVLRSETGWSIDDLDELAALLERCGRLFT